MNLVNCTSCKTANFCFLALINTDLRDLARKIRVFEFRHNQSIYRQGFPADGLFFVAQGSVRLTAITESGHERILDLVSCGELFGLDALLPERIRYESAEARESSTTVFLHASDFRDTMLSSPDLQWRVIVMLVEMLHRGNLAKLAISGDRVRERLQNFLGDLSCRMRQLKAETKPGFARLKQRELAGALGVPEETVSRELRLLDDDLKAELLNGRSK